MSIAVVVVNQSNTSVVVSAPTGVVTLGSSVEFLGSNMTGADSDTSRTYKRTGAGFSSSAKVFVGSDVDMRLIKSTKWSLSTTTVSNDTITLLVPVYDTDTITVFT